MWPCTSTPNCWPAATPRCVNFITCKVTRAWPEELRWLEYGQRLRLQRRNVAADPGHQPATAARLFEAVRAGGAAACGQPDWGLQPGARADLLLLDRHEPALLGLLGLPGLPDLSSSHLLDGLVFASPGRPFARALVAGRWCEPDTAALAERAARALAELAELEEQEEPAELADAARG